MGEQVIKPYEINPIAASTPTQICGLSARFPESSSGSEFFCNLVSGKDMITEDERKWRHIMHPGMPKRGGRMKLNELYSFDAQFFGVHGQQAKKMDPQLYKLLEVSYEAWMDSGIDVRSLRDSNRVGVYTGICGSEIHGWYLRHKHMVTGYEQTGCVMSMTANRLSYFYSFRGPSKTCDTACSSAAMSLHDAVADITAGRTDYAVVLGSCHTQAPNMTLAFNNLHMLSPEGACKAFDAAGNGYVRSEGIAAIVLQRAGMTDVPRWAAVSPYCTIKNININNDGYTKEGITFPSGKAQYALEQQVCEMGGINPADICYVEAHGTGTVAGDGQEMDAIDRWYGRAEGRAAPLLIGSVKSNMGHCEGASCLAGVIKCCLALEYGMMPGNLHFHKDTPNPDSLGLRDGTLEVVDTTRPFSGGTMALSSFGFGGANMHMVFEGVGGQRVNLVQSDTSSSSEGSVSEDGPADVVIPLAARTSEGLAYLAKVVNEAEASDGISFAEPLRRYANAVGTDIKLGHRGTLTNGELKAGAPVANTPQVWFVFSGNGSQWPRMGATLLTTNTTFLKSVTACAAVVKPLGIDLLAEFQAAKGWKTPLLNSIGLIAVQIGLVDVLREEYGVVADGMMGHSAGEIGCTYASGCCTKEQAMLIAYHRGRLPIEHNITSGLMAATGLSAEEARERTQGTNVVMACDNSPSSTTISGPADEVRALAKKLDAENIFARSLETNGVPYHSPVLDPLLKELDDCLKQVMPNPVQRPDSWVSAAFEAESTLPDASLCSAGYQVHSYRNPVLFTGAAAQVPKDALLVEIGPHSVLRSPLRQCRPDLGYVNVMRKGEDAQQTLAAAVGDMWRKGVPVQWKADPVPSNEFGTEVPRSIREALTSWDRTCYDVPVIELPAAPGMAHSKQYDLGGDDAYITEHCIDGVVFLPLSCFLVTAWEAFALFECKPINEYPVEFLNVEVFMPVRAEKTDKVVLEVLFDYNSKFQVIHNDEVICSGTLRKYDVEQRLHKEPHPYADSKNIAKPPKELTGVDPELYDHMTGEHWYSFCLRQNLQYGPRFKVVQKYGCDRTWAAIRWTGDENPIMNWIIHLDGLFQTTDREGDYDVHVAKGMRRLVVMDNLTGMETEGYSEQLEVDLNWRLTRSRCFILQNYQDEMAQSKHKAAKTLVHRLAWAAYGDRVLDNLAKTGYTNKLTAYVKQLLAGIKDNDPQLLKVKAIFSKVASKQLSPKDVETLTGAESNRLAAIFEQVLGSEDGPSTWLNAISDHSGLGQALAEDPFLSQSSQPDLEGILGIAISNMKSAGYTVGEVGATNPAFTKKALETFITVPQSSLRSYTATDSAATSDVTKAIPYSSLDYKSWDINKEGAKTPGPFNILVANNLSSTAQNLPAAVATLYDNVLEGGFVMLEELTGALGAAIYGFDESAWDHNDGRKLGPCTTVAHWKELLSGAGFTEVSVVRRPQDVSAVFLYRKVAAVPPKAVVLEAPTVNATEKMMDEWLPAYLTALDQVDAETEDGEPGTVWLYGDSVNHAGMLGFLTSARKEYKGDRLRAVVSMTPGADFNQLVQDARHSDLIINYYNGSRNGFYAPVQTEYKYLKDEALCKHGAHLNFEVYGNLRSSIWRENTPTPDNVEGILKCDVHFGALNFRDVMLAYGKLSKQQMAHESGGDNIGFEFSGYIEGTKTRVMGSAKNALSTKIVTRKDLIWEIPDSWSMAEAATVPTAYMTAYYSMVMRGRVKKGMRVLIHSGTGAVGLAAIQICLSRGAEVFVTVGTAAKRQFLLDAFPGLRDDHIGDSRSESFEGLVRNGTKGKGVHLLLNSLSDEKLQASVRCLGNWGKLLEIGKYDILQGTPLSMKPMLNNIAFEGIDVDRVMNHPDSTELAELNALVAAGLKSGEVKPLPVTIFNRSEVEEAFRYLASGVHMGKVMIDTTATPTPQHTNNCLGPKKAPPPANGSRSLTLPPLKLEPVLYFDPSKSYIVTGGLGGFGQAVFEFLSAFGAKNIVITSKRGVRNGNQQIALQALYNKGINFRVTTLDVGVPEEAEEIVALAESLAPVGGVFHLAMYLADKLVTNQNGESWGKVMHAKAKGAMNMDRATRRCKSLDHFVMWSSFVASAGNEGQTNYGYANACQDALSEQRRAAGLPSLSIQWGVIDHVGVADAAIQELMASGLLGASMAQPIDDCLKTLGNLIVAGPLQHAVMTSSWQPLDLLGKSSGGEAKNVLQAILQVMGLTVAEVNDADTLARLGIDSMQLVEARSNLQRALGRPVALDEASGMSIGDIKALEGDGDESAPAAEASEAAPAAAADAPPAESDVHPTKNKFAPLIHPAKLIDLQRDLPVQLPKQPEVLRAEAPLVKQSTKPAFKNAASLQPPATPERQSDLLRPSRFSGDSVVSQERSVSPSPEVISVPKPRALPAVAKPPAAKKLAVTPPASPTPASSVAAVRAPAGAPATKEKPYEWVEATNKGNIVLVSSVYLVLAYAFWAAAGAASSLGLLAALPLVPVIYLAAGFSLAAITVVLKSALMPRARLDQPIRLFSADFFKWWLLSRLIDITNILFMRNFRGTIVLNYYLTFLGAKVGEGAFIDTNDLMDLDCIEIGKDAVIGEGATVIGHTFKDGHIIFSKVVIGEGSQVYPFGVVTPATQLKAGQELTPLAKASAPLSIGSNKGLSAALANVHPTTELSEYHVAAAQVGVLLIPLLVATVAAFVGCATFQGVLARMGFHVDVSSGAYTTTALVAMSNPLLAIFGATMMPSGIGFSLGSMAASLPTVLAAFIALPLAWGAYALTLVALASFAKHFLTGRIEAGVHKRNSSYGISFWASQRLMELAYANVSGVVMGTWALNAIYRTFGASIGSYTSFRKVPAVNVPDMLKMGKLVVAGDTCKIASSIALDASSIVCAPIKIGDQGTLGASAVVLPGVTVGSQATLAPLTVPALGTVAEPRTIYIGAPAVPGKLDKRGEAVIDVQLPMHVLAQAMPFIQAYTILAVSLLSHLPSTAVALFIKSYNPGSIGSTVATYIAFCIQSQVLGLIITYLQGRLNIANPAVPTRQWSLPYLVSSCVTAVSIYCGNFGDAMWKSSPTWVSSLRRTGVDVGEDCYIDAEWPGEPGMAKYGDGAVADRGSIVFGHLMTHNGECFNVHFNHVSVGTGAQVSARSAIFPGVTLKGGEVVPSAEMRMVL